MGQTRKITYASTSGGTGGGTTIFSAAETWGELKSENVDIDAKATGMKAFIREDKRELRSATDKLPDGDFTLYFLMEKNNSGKN